MKMLGGYMEFFMKPELATMYLSIKKELGELVQKKVYIRLLHVLLMLGISSYLCLVVFLLHLSHAYATAALEPKVGHKES